MQCMTVEHQKPLLISNTRSSHRLPAYGLSLSLFQIPHDLSQNQKTRPHRKMLRRQHKVLVQANKSLAKNWRSHDKNYHPRIEDRLPDRAGARSGPSPTPVFSSGRIRTHAQLTVGPMFQTAHFGHSSRHPKSGRVGGRSPTSRSFLISAWPCGPCLYHKCRRTFHCFESRHHNLGKILSLDCRIRSDLVVWVDFRGYCLVVECPNGTPGLAAFQECRAQPRNRLYTGTRLEQH